MKEFDDTEHDPYTNARKKEILLERHGSVCQGCGIELHERYLELDHQLPRADGGSNLLRNRILLCGPCNKLKRHLYTISWLRKGKQEARLHGERRRTRLAEVIAHSGEDPVPNSR